MAQKPAQSDQGGRAALALLTMLLFAGVALWQIGFNPLALTGWLLLLIGVLLLHEAGHYAGMRLFGYHDLRVFFYPFFTNLREALGDALELNREDARRAAGQDYEEVVMQP